MGINQNSPGTRCSRRMSISGEGADIHFTRKNNDLYIILDGLKDGDTTVFVPDVAGEPVSLDDTAQVSCNRKEDGIEIMVEAHKVTDCAVVLKIHNGE